jgi:hypothetical protein
MRCKAFAFTLASRRKRCFDRLYHDAHGSPAHRDWRDSSSDAGRKRGRRAFRVQGHLKCGTCRATLLVAPRRASLPVVRRLSRLRILRPPLPGGVSNRLPAMVARDGPRRAWWPRWQAIVQVGSAQRERVTPTRINCGSARSFGPDTCLLAASFCRSTAKQRSRLKQRCAPDGCVGERGSSWNDWQTCPRPALSNQPSRTPCATAQQSAASSLPPTW